MRAASVVDVRRLTGPNVLARVPLVVVDVGHEASLAESEGRLDAWSARDIDELLALYLGELGPLRAGVGLSAEVTPLVRSHRGGVTFGYAAPEDILLVCAEMSEWAITRAVARWTGAAAVAGAAAADADAARETFATMLVTDANPNMVALAREAERRGAPFLWDDEAVTVGEGRRSRTYALAQVPSIADVPWGELGRIPVALVTGTNGKTTSTRLLAHCLRAGRGEGRGAVGVASSDGVLVGTALVERGDWTGPGAARRVLRDVQVDAAVLETARGGILRRGLAIAQADVALLTNVSADHLGGYGIDDVEAMAEVKAVVARAGRTVVLNAGDANLVRLGRERPASQVVYFADLDGPDPNGDAATVLAEHLAAGGKAVFTRAGSIFAADGSRPGAERDPELDRDFGRVDEVPITFRGAARYNVENVLGAVAAACALGVDDEAIRRSIRAFDGDDNPRRGQLVERRGVRVFLDFGHNPEAVRASMGVVATLRKGHRLTVVVGSPGDRSDADMAEVARAVFDAHPDRIVARDLAHYLRGRAPGEVPSIYAHAFRALGVPEDAFCVVASEVEALTQALATAAPGDVIAVLVHLDHEEVRAWLETMA